MPYANAEENTQYYRDYQSAENVWRPLLFKSDLDARYIKAIHIQAKIDEGTVSSVIAGYIKEGLLKDGRIKSGAI